MSVSGATGSPVTPRSPTRPLARPRQSSGWCRSRNLINTEKPVLECPATIGGLRPKPVLRNRVLAFDHDANVRGSSMPQVDDAVERQQSPPTLVATERTAREWSPTDRWAEACVEHVPNAGQEEQRCRYCRCGPAASGQVAPSFPSELHGTERGILVRSGPELGEVVHLRYIANAATERYRQHLADGSRWWRSRNGHPDSRDDRVARRRAKHLPTIHADRPLAAPRVQQRPICQARRARVDTDEYHWNIQCPPHVHMPSLNRGTESVSSTSAQANGLDLNVELVWGRLPSMVVKNRRVQASIVWTLEWLHNDTPARLKHVFNVPEGKPPDELRIGKFGHHMV